MGDGIFKWYYAGGSDPEEYMAADSKEHAIEEGQGLDFEGGFTILEADMDAPIINFNGEDVLVAFDEQNEECWGEEGTGIDHITDDQAARLGEMMNETFKQWMKEQNIKFTAWSFGIVRYRQYFAPEVSENKESTNAD